MTLGRVGDAGLPGAVDGLVTVEFDQRSLAEASALVAVEDRDLLSRCGWDLGFWLVRDEPAVEDSIILVGRTSDPQARFEVVPVRLAARGSDGKPTASNTSDSEAVARKAGWVYVVGSHFGSDRHGLQAKRAFVARFRERDVDIDVQARPAAMEVMKDEFRVHRLVNDALQAPGVLPSESTSLGRKLEHRRKAFIETTREHVRGEASAGRLSEQDWPINIEGATFHRDGSLILGLRFPVGSGGHPVLVRVDGVERLFDDGGPAVCEVVVLDDIGTERTPVGVRDVDATDESLHVLVGGLDQEMFDDYEKKPRFAHWRSEPGSPRMTLIREFPKKVGRVEGLTVDLGGHAFYVCDDEDRVRVLFEVDD